MKNEEKQYSPSIQKKNVFDKRLTESHCQSKAFQIHWRSKKHLELCIHESFSGFSQELCKKWCSISIEFCVNMCAICVPTHISNATYNHQFTSIVKHVIWKILTLDKQMHTNRAGVFVCTNARSVCVNEWSTWKVLLEIKCDRK